MENERKKRSTPKYIVLLLLLSLALITAGTSFAFFEYMTRGTTENYIETANVIFRYDEKETQGNGLLLKNQLPIADEVGKQLEGENQTFDFDVFTNVQDMDIKYQLIATKEESTDLPEEFVKIYLTQVDGDQENPVKSTLHDDGEVVLYNELEDVTFNNQEGKVLYEEVMNNKEDYMKSFRLRMWVSNEVDALDEAYMEKEFSIKVSIFAISV